MVVRVRPRNLSDRSIARCAFAYVDTFGSPIHAAGFTVAGEGSGHPAPMPTLSARPCVLVPSWRSRAQSRLQLDLSRAHRWSHRWN